MKAPRKIEFVLIPADRWPRGFGHGVEFHHDALPPRQVVAFIEGYNWSRKPSETVVVQLLGTCPEASLESRWNEILDDARSAVRVFLEDESKLFPFHYRGVRDHWNA